MVGALVDALLASEVPLVVTLAGVPFVVAALADAAPLLAAPLFTAPLFAAMMLTAMMLAALVFIAVTSVAFGFAVLEPVVFKVVVFKVVVFKVVVFKVVVFKVVVFEACLSDCGAALSAGGVSMGTCGNPCVATSMLASADAGVAVSFRLRIASPPTKLSGSVPFVVALASPGEGPGLVGSATLCSADGIATAKDDVDSGVGPVAVDPADVAARGARIVVLPPSMARMMASARVSGVVKASFDAAIDAGTEADLDAEPPAESVAPPPSPCSAPCAPATGRRTPYVRRARRARRWGR